MLYLMPAPLEEEDGESQAGLLCVLNHFLLQLCT